ncbi:MAG: OmpH family outer membrane protein [Treponema sp.]|nr:OmpH family outer membrane protein [Treponema sp.]
MLKRVVVLLILCVSCFGLIYGQQITRIAVVDLPRVYQVFLRDSQAVREFEQQSARVQAEIDGFQREIQELRTRREQAVAQNNQTEVLRLDREILAKNEFLRDFFQTRTAELNAQRNQLMQSDSFLNQVQNEIRFIGESEGYSMVIDIKNTAGIIWYSPSVDITDILIRRLQSRARN